jgi:predicted nucleotidyltransferase
MMADPPIAPAELIARFSDGRLRALALLGSYARDDAGPWSDLDVVRFVGDDADDAEAETHLIADHLVVVSTVTPAQVTRWFAEPSEAVKVIAGLRAGRALYDPSGDFAALQARAAAFVWDAAMQMRADRWASRQMVGGIEEVHKGLEGLRRADIGRLLNARFGLSWGLARVMLVQRGIMLSGDNAFMDVLARELGPDSAWVALHRRTFAIADVDGTPPSLREQVIAGLRLYALTARMLVPILAPDDAPLIRRTAEQIVQTIGA